MAVFLIDIGNTNIKWAIALGDRKVSDVASERQPPKEFDEFAQTHWTKFEPPTSVIISNVGPLKLVDKVTTWIEQVWGIKAQIIVSPGQGWGITNAYVEPKRLGSDRWAALVAARTRTRRASCVVDCGTAVTIDVVGADGKHHGGLIVPGLTLMRDSLIKRTAQIKTSGKPLDSANSLLARDTIGSVQGGSLYALIAFIDRVVNDVEAELGGTLQCFITGGDGGVVRPLLAHRFEHAPDLVLEGLAAMAGET